MCSHHRIKSSMANSIFKHSFMCRKNDILLKSAFKEAFPDLLRFFFQEADTIFDIGKGFEFMDKELSEIYPELEKKGGSRFVDMLVKTYLKNGSEEWMLIHLEIQDRNDKHFAKRTFQYFYRIYDRYEIDLITGNYRAMGIIETIKMLTREEALEEGIEKGREKEKINFVHNLLLNTDFDVARIATLTGASQAFVNKIKKEIKR